MYLDLKKLRESGKDREDFFFEYLPETNLIEIPGAEIKNPVKINGTMILTDRHSANIEGEVQVIISGECTRCLNPVDKEMFLEFSEHVSMDGEDGYKVKNDKIDLSKIIDDLIVINEPVSMLCREDCKGICTGCGVNLNDSACKCEK